MRHSQSLQLGILRYDAATSGRNYLKMVTTPFTDFWVLPTKCNHNTFATEKIIKKTIKT